MTAVRVLERLTRHCALGLRPWDLATGDGAVAGLQVAVYPRANPAAVAVAQPNRSGTYVAHAVPGLRDFELGAEPGDDAATATWATAARPCRIRIVDPQRRFLPLELDADLPARGLLRSVLPAMSPPLGAGSPPLWPGDVPLFTAPGRPLPDPLAVVHAQLRHAVPGTPGGRPAAWALLGALVDGQLCGIGLADAQGRVALMFPYPEPPRPRLASPAGAHDDFSWALELAAWWTPADPARPVPDVADLGTVLAQLAQPRSVLLSAFSPAPPLRLAYRVPLTARTDGAAGGGSSFLFIA